MKLCQGLDVLHWQKAIQSECNSLMDNKTWTLVDRPINKSIVISGWIYMCKYNFNCALKYKVDFVFLGFHQTST
jgi:hypothetical protein